MKRGWLIFLGIVLVLVVLLGGFFYYALAKPKSNNQMRALENPAANLSIEEARARFDESFIYYLLASIKAYNLHAPPLSSDAPKIEIAVGDKVFSAVVNKGEILVNNKAINNEDIRITTPLDEAIAMIKYPDYVQSSFADGKSDIELVASKTTLFAKGYLSLYTELTGKSVTGNVFRIYRGN